MPRVSVIIPTFNAANYLEETLASVLGQTYKDIEVIVVDDGSTDNTAELVVKFGNRIRYVRQTNSSGPSWPRNVGICLAKGSLISFFDSDDVMLPDKIGSAVRLFERRPEIGMVFTNFAVCDENGRVAPGRFLDRYDYFHSMNRFQVSEKAFLFRGGDIFDGLFFENFIGTSSVMVRKDVFSKIGLFDHGLRTSEDRDMWFRISKEYDAGYVEMVGHLYRDRPGGISKRGAETLENRVKVIERHRTGAHSGKARKRARELIALCYYGIGYHYQAAMDFGTARRLYVRSLEKRVNTAALRGLLITLIGSRAAGSLKAVVRGR